MPNARRLFLSLAAVLAIVVAPLVSPTQAQTQPKPAQPQTKPATRPAKPGDVPELNQKILKFCTENMGKKVSDGECAMLVVEAYKTVGAATRHQLPKPDVQLQDDDYHWGRLLGPKDIVLPGDIIQFRDIVIKQKTARGTTTNTMSHHTAVVRSVISRNNFAVLHQNTGGNGVSEEKRKTVQAGTINLNNKTQGQVWIYRPIPIEEAKAASQP